MTRIIINYCNIGFRNCNLNHMINLLIVEKLEIILTRIMRFT